MDMYVLYIKSRIDAFACSDRDQQADLSSATSEEELNSDLVLITVLNHHMSDLIVGLTKVDQLPLYLTLSFSA